MVVWIPDVGGKTGIIYRPDPVHSLFLEKDLDLPVSLRRYNTALSLETASLISSVEAA